MMTIEKHASANKPKAIDRRTGMDRRMLTYDYYIPERRVTVDRRSGKCRLHREHCHGEWRDRRRYA